MVTQPDAGLAEQAAEFCLASIADWTGKAARMLADMPELAQHSLATALVLGDVDRVREEIERDPVAATRTDAQTGWTALHVVCASKWPGLDPARTAGLVSTARLLLDAGADPNARIAGGRSAGSSALRCAAAAASSGSGNAGLMQLLMERGAVAGDEELYLAAFGDDDHRCLRVLLAAAPDAAASAQTALSAPVSMRDVEGVRLLLEAGADPRRYAEEPDRPISAAYAAIQADCPAELIALLVERGADPHEPGPDGRSPAWLAAIRGRDDLAGLVGEAGTDTARFVGACVRADRTGATGLAAADPGLIDRLAEDELAALVPAAGAGKTAAVELMLDLGFPVQVRGEDGATPLHAAAYAGSAAVIRLLLDHGADLAALDGSWQSPPLDWAVVGSGQRPATCPDPDWVAAARLLIEAGAPTAGISLSPGDPKPSSAAVAELLRSFGAGAD